MMNSVPTPRFAFFGSPPLGVAILDVLEQIGMLPQLVVCQPDRPAGRGLTLKQPPEKEWAVERGIAVAQPNKITSEFVQEISRQQWDVFVVAAYGKILPKSLLDIPRKGAVNMHPSLLPRLRGPSPIRSAILEDEKSVGVSIMLLDEQMDHGPLLGQRQITVEWPPRGNTLDSSLAHAGAGLLAEILPRYLSGDITPTEQDHSAATYCTMFTKEMGELDLVDGDPHENLLKIRAFEGWPGTYAFFEKDGARVRAKILEAHLDGGRFVVDTVIPEGKGAMPYSAFVATGARPLSR